jgi:signal transduction histidine kinase
MANSLSRTNAERNKLLAELERKERLRRVLLKKMLSAQEDERKRISRELHDETGQALTSLLVSMRVLADRTTDPQQKDILMGARDLAANTLRNIRNLAVELRPPVIDDLGLVPAIRKYLSQFEELHGVPISFTAVNGRVHDSTAMALYRVVQESLTNIIKHADACLVEISMDIRENHIELVIHDDGKGFDVKAMHASRKDNRVGLAGMRERVELLGGTLTIISRPQQGTTITVVVPNPREE